MKHFRGDRMRELRESLHITQDRLASMTSVKRAQITNIESAGFEPSLAVAVELAIALQCSLDYLVDLSDNPGNNWKVRETKVKRLVLNRTLD